jgi:drug/metabolite transporter (DMT)-like permease
VKRVTFFDQRSSIGNRRTSQPINGIYAALASAFFLGLAPIFGRQAILLGMAPLAVVATRTALAALLLLVVIGIFYRSYLFIYPAGLLGCVLAGWINGLGSLFYYSALGRIEAGLGQLLYSLYPLFLALWLSLDKQPPSRLTLVRLGLALPAILLLVQVEHGQTIDLVGVFMMLVASALYALHLPFNQRVLYDMPTPTVTLYTLIAMSTMVVPVYLVTRLIIIPAGGAHIAVSDNFSNATSDYFSRYLWPIMGLTLVTFLSRLTLFFGVKHLGGMQTALLGLSELLVTLIFAHWLLGESFSRQQWIGIGLLVFSLALVGLEKSPRKRQGAGGFLSWIGSSHLTSEGWQPND